MRTEDLMDCLLDCGDSSCEFALKRTGMRTNGGCRCLVGIAQDFELRIRLRKHHKAMKALLLAERAALDELRGMAGMVFVRAALGEELEWRKVHYPDDTAKLDALAALLKLLGGET